jgi:hypothetical protein
MAYKTPNAKIQFAKMAREDAEHDIPMLTSEFKNNNILKSFNTGLPPNNSNNKFPDEWAVLNSIVEGFQNKINQGIPDVTQELKDPIGLDVKIPDTEFKMEYTASSFTIKCDTNEKANLEPATDDVGSNFCINTGLCGTTKEAIFVIDFNQHGFLSKLRSGATDNEYTIHIVTTPEVINDPAPKPSVHNVELFNPDSVNTGVGITLKSYTQTSVESCIYSSYEDDIIDVNNNFFSTLDFTLSPIQQIFEKKTSRLVTNLNIKQFGTKPININDSKSGNSNATVFSMLNSIIKKIGPNVNKQLDFDFNVNCQRKRGGDWWQALCCHDIYNRTFTEILPVLGTEANGRANIAFNRQIPVYFVTHDKIACAYALMMGCNVVFVDWYGRVIVLKNTTDPANTTANSTSREESIFNKLKPLSSLFSDLSTKITQYQSVRYSIIQGAETDLSNNIITCTTAIGTITNTNFQLIVGGVIIKDVFRAAVKLEFTRQSLIDVSNDLAVINNNQDILTGLYNTVNNDKLLKLNRSYYRLLSIQNQINKFTTDDGTDMSGALNAWMACIEKQNVYKVIGKLFGTDEDQDNLTFDIRLLNVSNQPKVFVDKHIFLPYIQNLSPENKNKINDLLNLLVPISVGYSLTLSETGFFRRGGRVPATRLFFNKVANFIVECRHFVYVVQEPEIIVPIVSDSTDVILVGEDFNDITNLKNNDNSIDDQEQGDNIIVNCVVETKQVTSSLLTGLLTNNYLTNMRMKTRSFFNNLKGGALGVEGESLPPLRESTQMTTEYIDSITGLESIELNPFDDVNFGYHPLLPIYMILSSFWNSLEPKLVDSCYYYRYANYYTMLEKMVTEITTNYLGDPKNNSIIVSAYLIGFSLKSFFFTADHYPDIFGKFKDLFEDYKMVSLLNSSFSNAMSGNIIESQHEQDFTLQLLNSQLIKKFFTKLDINNIDVNNDNIKITDDMDVINKQNVLANLNNNIYNLLERIVNKITMDRTGNDFKPFEQIVPIVNDPIITKPSLERSTSTISESGSEGSRTPMSDSESSIGNQESLLSSGKDNTGYSSGEESTNINSVSQSQSQFQQPSQFQPQSQFESQPITSTYDEKYEGSTTPLTDNESIDKEPLTKKRKSEVGDNKMEIGGKKYTKKTNKGKSKRKTKKT